MSDTFELEVTLGEPEYVDIPFLMPSVIGTSEAIFESERRRIAYLKTLLQEEPDET